jgi:hypothetical protein
MRTKRDLWKEGGRDVWYGTSSIRKVGGTLWVRRLRAMEMEWE